MKKTIALFTALAVAEAASPEMVPVAGRSDHGAMVSPFRHEFHNRATVVLHAGNAGETSNNVEGKDKGKESVLLGKYPKTIRQITDYTYGEVNEDDELGATTLASIQHIVKLLNEAERLGGKNGDKEKEILILARDSATRLQSTESLGKLLKEPDPKTSYRIGWRSKENRWTLETTKKK